MNDVIPQGDVIVVEDRVDMQCMRHVHWMANHPVGSGKWEVESGVWHLRWSGPFRGALDVHAEGWVKMRRLVVWSLAISGQRSAVSDQRSVISVREGLRQAAEEFERSFGRRPMYGFVKRMPRAAGGEAVEVDEITLLEAEWMLERCVAVGGRRQNAEG